jgi:hypothetical protein
VKSEKRYPVNGSGRVPICVKKYKNETRCKFYEEFIDKNSEKVRT